MKAIITYQITGTFKIEKQVGRPSRAIAAVSIFDISMMDTGDQEAYGVEAGMNYIADVTRIISSDYRTVIRQFKTIEEAISEAEIQMIGIDGKIIITKEDV